MGPIKSYYSSVLSEQKDEASLFRDNNGTVERNYHKIY